MNTSAAEAWKICKFDDSKFVVEVGFDGTTTYSPRVFPATSEMKAEISCLQFWGKPKGFNIIWQENPFDDEDR